MTRSAVPENELVSLYATEEAEDRRSLRYALVVAVVLHLIFLCSAIPTLQSSEAAPAEKPKVLRLEKTPRFRAEPPPPVDPPKRRERVREIPMPDPDPDFDAYVAEIEPEVEIPLDEDPFFALPSAPPAPVVEEITGPIRVGGRVSPPTRTHYVEPTYPPLARRARIQGRVILEATIDTSGRVVDLTVMKGGAMGLSQAAVDAVSEWRFEPSMLGDTPVPVLYRIEVEFTLR